MDALHGRKKSHYILKKTGAKQTERVFSAMCLSIAVSSYTDAVGASHF